MNRRNRMPRRHGLGQLVQHLLLVPPAILLYLLVGCASFTQQTRLQNADETEKDRYSIKTVGDVSKVGNAAPIPLAGVGLVVGLPGTGGESPNDGYRTMLEDQLRKKGIRDVKKLLASSDVALVLVQAQLPPGAGRGDALDVEVELPPRSKATSLRGGYLRECVLFNYDYARNLSPEYSGPADRALKGNVAAKAEGPLLVGFGEGDEANRERRGRIWGGAHATQDAPFSLVLNNDQQYVRVASNVSDRVNDTFHGAFHGNGPNGTAVALARDKYAVALRVPAQYKLNMPRYLRVVRLVPLREEPENKAAGEVVDHRSYRQKLADDLLDPARTVTAALRLEALGQSSIPALKTGLESKQALVRFCAAEALAYLGSPSCGDELARAVEQQPALRAFALTALASVDEAVAHLKLRDLLATSGDDETRYGAFRALRALDETDEAVRGEYLNDSFWLHKVPGNTTPLVHISSTRRAEIVLFGEEPFLKAPFSFLAGEFTVTSADGDTRCTITKVPLHGGATARRQCSLKLEDMLKTLADLGGAYPEAVELLQQAHGCQCLSSRVRVDALPQAISVFELAKSGKNMSAGGEEVITVVPGEQDLGLTPTLYEISRPTKTAAPLSPPTTPEVKELIGGTP